MIPLSILNLRKRYLTLKVIYRFYSIYIQLVCLPHTRCRAILYDKCIYNENTYKEIEWWLI